MTESLFDLGRMVTTANAMQTLQVGGQLHIVQTNLGRHSQGDWEDLDPDERGSS